MKKSWMMQVQHGRIEEVEWSPRAWKPALRGPDCLVTGSVGVTYAAAGVWLYNASLAEATVGGGRDGNGKMTVTVRRLEKSEDEYIAYAKSLCGKATYFLYFTDGMYGAVALCNFVAMLKGFFQVERIDLSVHENAVSLKHEEMFALLKGDRP